jgi:hypothetical protein
MTLAHVGNDGTAKSAHGRQLRRSHLFPLGLGSRHNASRISPTSVIDENIDAAETLQSGCDNVIRLIWRTYIRCYREHFDCESVADLLCGFRKPCGSTGN